MSLQKLLEKTKNNVIQQNVGNKKNINKTGYYWIQLTKDTEQTIGFYQQHKKAWALFGYSELVDCKMFKVNWNKITQFDESLSKSSIIFNTINNLEIGESIVRNEFIALVWGDCDHFIKRSFSVMLLTAYKKINEECKQLNIEQKEFSSKMGTITRIK